MVGARTTSRTSGPGSSHNLKDLEARGALRGNTDRSDFILQDEFQLVACGGSSNTVYGGADYGLLNFSKRIRHFA